MDLKKSCMEARIDQLTEENMILKDKVEVLYDRIDSVINILEKDENKEPIEVILNNVGKALDILKGR